MKAVTPVSTEQIREATSKGFVGSLGYTSVSDTQFDLWLATERHRVADLAITKERERIIKLLEELADDFLGNESLTPSELIRYSAIRIREDEQ